MLATVLARSTAVHQTTRDRDSLRTSPALVARPAARCVRVADAGFDQWFLSRNPSRKATPADCENACSGETSYSVHSTWCVGFEFEGTEKGTCQLFADCNSANPQCLQPDECTKAATNDVVSQAAAAAAAAAAEAWKAAAAEAAAAVEAAAVEAAAAMAEGQIVAEAEAKAEAKAKEEAKAEAKAEARVAGAGAAAEAEAEAEAAEAAAPTWTPRLRQPHVAFEAKFGKSAYSWTVCSFDAQKAAAAHSNERPVWRDSHEWQTYKWAKLPKQTHLLLFGTSSMGQLGSALRAAAASHGILENTVTVSANRDCDDPTIDPRTRPWPQSTKCMKACKKMRLGPSGATCKNCNSGDRSCARCRHDPHAITVDHLSGGSTITTIANHGQSQRLHARLDEYLSMVALRQLPNGTSRFTHGAFMSPHTDTWYDARCELIRAQAREGGSEQGMEEDDPEPEQEYREAQLNEMQPKKLHLVCGPEADAQCPRRHPHFATMAKWVDHEVAAVISPARDEHENTPFVQYASAGTGRFRGDFPLRCVTDTQLQSRHECPNGRNTTVWLGQSEIVYKNSGGAGTLPSSRNGGGPPCYCEHLCNARCARGGRCYAGPGLAAAWLVLRAAGLASSIT